MLSATHRLLALLQQSHRFAFLLLRKFDARSTSPTIGNHQPQPHRHGCPTIGATTHQRLAIEPKRSTVGSDGNCRSRWQLFEFRQWRIGMQIDPQWLGSGNRTIPHRFGAQRRQVRRGAIGTDTGTGIVFRWGSHDVGGRVCSENRWLSRGCTLYLSSPELEWSPFYRWFTTFWRCNYSHC